jgi:hypothetical protein
VDNGNANHPSNERHALVACHDANGALSLRVAKHAISDSDDSLRPSKAWTAIDRTTGSRAAWVAARWGRIGPSK